MSSANVFNFFIQQISLSFSLKFLISPLRWFQYSVAVLFTQFTYLLKRWFLVLKCLQASMVSAFFKSSLWFTLSWMFFQTFIQTWFCGWYAPVSRWQHCFCNWLNGFNTVYIFLSLFFEWIKKFFYFLMVFAWMICIRRCFYWKLLRAVSYEMYLCWCYCCLVCASVCLIFLIRVVCFKNRIMYS